MILLTRLDGKPVVVNEDHILFVEHTPDSMLVLTNGNRLMVREALDVVVERVSEFRKKMLVMTTPETGVLDG